MRTVHDAAAMSASRSQTPSASASLSAARPAGPPLEGQYDFSLVDAQIAAAREQGLRLILIWFGAFKNGGSSYAPRWVRADTVRFPRAALHAKPALWTYPGQTPRPELTVFSTELRAADARAFIGLMSHLLTADPEHVVVMMQVQNEVGVLGDSRDRSSAALEAWQTPVPPELIAHLRSNQDRLRPELDDLWSRHGNRESGTWAEVFGEELGGRRSLHGLGVRELRRDPCPRGGKAVQAASDAYANAWLGPQPGQPCAGDLPQWRADQPV